MKSASREFPNRLKAIRHLKKVDPKLKDLIEKAGPFDLKIAPEESIYESLARSIFYQQLHGKAAATILKRVEILCRGNTGKAGAFPKPEVILAQSELALRGAGLSSGKIKALVDLATKVKNKELPLRSKIEKMTDEEIIQVLTSVRGIGPWTVHMMLIFSFGRPDVFPTTDYGVRNGYKIWFNKRELPAPKKLEKFGAHWAPFRSVASWYLWRAVDLHKGELK